MLTNEEIAAQLDLGHELRSVEYKAAGMRSDKTFLAKVARAALALTNQRGGGHIIIGLAEEQSEDEYTGLDDQQLHEWLEYDDVSAQINAYADPPLELQVAQRQLPNGRQIIVIEVAEFGDVPVLCKKDFPGVLQANQLYTRSLAKPESSPTHTQNEVREVLALGVEKQLRQFVETTRRAGIDLGPTTPSSTELYVLRIAEFIDQDESAAAVSADSHFRVWFAPQDFGASAIDYAALKELVRLNQVANPRASFPVIRSPQNGDEWIGDRSDWGDQEVWRFYQSGLFIDMLAIGHEYKPDWDSFGRENDDGYLPVWLPLWYFTQAFEFAARMQRAAFPTATLVLHLEVNSISGRALVAANQRRSGFNSTYAFGSPSWKRDVRITPELALSGTRELVVELMTELYLRFGWEGATTELVTDMQAEISRNN
ncbi:MAG TPA: RNA-binding domain-containing protein [Galbitalea sp.]|jgi:hypothetical protein